MKPALTVTPAASAAGASSAAAVSVAAASSVAAGAALEAVSAVWLPHAQSEITIATDKSNAVNFFIFLSPQKD